MERTIGKDIENLFERKRFIEDNAAGTEKISYNRKLNKDELQELSKKLVDNNIQIRELKEEKKMAMRQFTDRQKEMEDAQAGLIDKLKNESEFISNEECYKFPDFENRRMYFYNKLGDMVYERALKPDERQMSMTHLLFEKTGTED